MCIVAFYLSTGLSWAPALHVGVWTILVLTATAIFHLLCLSAIWRWQRWGVYGFIVGDMLSFGTVIVAGLPIAPNIGRLLNIDLVAHLVSSKWLDFE